jgi:hypothetical protein
MPEALGQFKRRGKMRRKGGVRRGMRGR